MFSGSWGQQARKSRAHQEKTYVKWDIVQCLDIVNVQIFLQKDRGIILVMFLIARVRCASDNVYQKKHENP